jgi:hypothetical protein
MDQRRSKLLTVSLALLATAILSFCVGVYTFAYFATFKEAHFESSTTGNVRRIYPSVWQANLFRPAARIESVIRWSQVETYPQIWTDADYMQ